LKKRLFIISETVDYKFLKENLNDSTEILALTPISMLSLDSTNTKYKTIHDYYSIEDYKNELVLMRADAEKIFLKIDKVIDKYLNFKYSYSGNNHYFMQFLGDMLFFEKLSLKINKIFSDIYILGFDNFEELSWSSLNYSDLKSSPSSETISIPQTTGLKNIIKIFQNTINFKPNHNLVGYKSKNIEALSNISLQAYYNRGKRFLKRSIFLRTKRNNKYNTNKNIFVIQDGYEVELLKPYMKEYNFINDFNKIRERNALIKPKTLYSFDEISSVLKPFLEFFWPKLSSLIISLLISYDREVVGRIIAFKTLFEKSFQKNKPKALFYSVGNRDVFDTITSQLANKSNIPVIYFQHGGATIYFDCMYQKYVETDKKTKKILILNSSVENININHNDSKSAALGSMLRYEWINSHSRIKNKKNKIIYVSSAFSSDRFRQLENSHNSKEAYQISSDIINIVKNKNVNLDIKPHPSGYNNQIKYYKELLKIKNYKKARIIYGAKAEDIIQKYGLIIIDSLASTVTSHLLSLKVPILLYVKDISLINKIVLKDIKKRCYLVSDYKMLKNVINKHVNGELPTKWSADIIDRYIYPLDKGNPGENISKYLRSLL
jgi:hypothetical protein